MMTADNLTKLISESCTIWPFDYNGKILRFKFQGNKKEILEDEFKTFGISPIFFDNDECEIELTVQYKNNTVFFSNEKDFLNRIETFKDRFDQLTLAIVQYEGKYLIKQAGEQFTEEKAIFFNTVSYRNIIDFIAESSEFISFHDADQHRFIIFSGDKGPFFIGYKRGEKNVKMLPDLELQLEHLKKDFAKIDYVQFFKAAVIQGIHTLQEEDRFFELVKSIQVLLDISTRDHNIYLRQFGFDKIKAKFKEERVKYFESIEKNIDSVSKQVTSFPLTFAASIFAGYQVKDKSFILFLILGAYTLYTIIAWKILDVVAFNRQKIEEDVDHEKSNIQTGYKVLYDDFKSDFEKIDDKISRLKNLIKWLRGILVALLLGFAIFCIYEKWFAVPAQAGPTEVRLVK